MKYLDVNNVKKHNILMNILIVYKKEDIVKLILMEIKKELEQF